MLKVSDIKKKQVIFYPYWEFLILTKITYDLRMFITQGHFYGQNIMTLTRGGLVIDMQLQIMIRNYLLSFKSA